MCTLGNQTVVAPAVVYLSETSALVFGEAAERRALSQPDRVEREFKRRLGDPTPVVLGGVPYQVTALMGAQLRDVLATVAKVEGSPPDHVVLTYPATWGPYRRELFDDVPQFAGLSSHVAMTEPEAAAGYYGASRYLDEGDTIAVYDLGGGTFDATVLRKHGGVVHVVGEPEGIERLGGIDFDEAIIQWINYRHGGALAELDMADPQAMAAMVRVRHECVQAKEALSSDTETTIPVLLPNRQFSVRLTRPELEGMIRAPIESTIGALIRTVHSAHVDVGQLSAVLLVGGSSRIPLIERMIAEEIGCRTVVDAHPKYSVALGAAMIAGRRATSADAVGMRTSQYISDAGARTASPLAAAGGQPAREASATSISISESGDGPRKDTATSPSPGPELGSTGGGERPARSRRRVRIGLAIAVAVVLGGSAFVYLANGSRSPSASAPTSTATRPPSSAASAVPTNSPPQVVPAVPVPRVGAAVKLATAPKYAAASPNGHQVYIANGNDAISVLNTADDQVTTNDIRVPGPAQFLSFSPDGRYIYVSLWDKTGGNVHSVSVLDAEDNSVKATIPVDTRPFLSAVTPDGRWLYVPNHDTHTISVIDTNSDQVVDKISVAPNPHYVSFSVDGKRAYVADHESNLVTVIDTANRQIVKEVPVGAEPHSVAQNPRRPQLMNVNWAGQSVDVIDTNTNTVVKLIRVGVEPLDLRWSADGRFAYVVNNASNQVSVISADSLEVTATLTTGKNPTAIAVLPDGSKGYVSNNGDNTLTVLYLN